jgi:hypothetical protein
MSFAFRNRGRAACVMHRVPLLRTLERSKVYVATDFRSGRDFPRRGRENIGGYLWLARVFDKARAHRDGTIHDYIYPCPMDRGVFDRWGITSRVFDAALDTCATDDEILGWLRARVPSDRRDTANRWLIDEKSTSLDRQDAEEGVVAVSAEAKRV